jgi:uncharacterized membrane protein YeaQ/YmgE (transglycosylase-associated protein family)
MALPNSADHLVVLLLVGLVAGFLAAHVVAGRGFGLLIDLVVGVVGAFLGAFVLGALGVVASTLLGEIVVAFIGAVILLAILRLFMFSRWRGRRRLL